MNSGAIQAGLPPFAIRAFDYGLLGSRTFADIFQLIE